MPLLLIPVNTWFFLGITAIAMAVCNLASAFVFKRDPKWFRFCSLALTALTVCTFFNEVAIYLQETIVEGVEPIHSGIGSIYDVAIPGAKIFMTATLASILLNVTTLIPWKGSKKK